MDTPISPYQKTGGLVYFARMLSKIRFKAAGKLRQDFHNNLGKGFDGRCTRYLHVEYSRLVERVLEGGTDDEILVWCFAKGRQLNEEEIFIWNGFMTKCGLKDGASEELEEQKKANGLADRLDVETYFEFYEIDESRKESASSST